jgi:type II secretory pathway component PulK
MNSGHQQGGYVLVLVLGFLALLALVAERFASRIEMLRERTDSLARYAEGATAMQSARATALYWIAVQPTSAGGFGAGSDLVAVDGRTYRVSNAGGDPVWVSLQDHRGLVSLNLVDAATLGQFLQLQGVPALRVPQLLDSLADYTDSDNLRRLSGAEAPDYAELGLPPPRNAKLISTAELRNVLGWRDFPAVIESAERFASTRLDALFNPNAAPREVLQALWPNVPAPVIEQVLALRAQTPGLDPMALQRLTGVPLGDNAVPYASDFVRLTVASAVVPYAVVYNVRVTPDGGERPWQILNVHSIELVAEFDAHIPAPLFPARLAASRDPDRVGTTGGGVSP